jgi:thiol-disulfide isomerase/thioredoxin
MMDKTATPEAMMDKPTEGAMMEAPAWFSTPLTNVNSGENFTINDFKGKVVLVETMAQWCPSCKKQQQQVKTLHEKLGMPADLVSIVLDIDPNESADTLKAYAAGNGFDWIYAVAPAEVTREISNLYGDQFLNPPSTPILIIDRKGEVHMLPFGIKSADELKEAIEPYLNGM